MSRNRILCLLSTALLSIVAFARAADKADSFTDPEQAGPNYKLQGEYLGGFDIGDGAETMFGMQLVDLGGGKFEGVGYFGGLPGQGWDGFTKLPASGELKDGVIEVSRDEGTVIIKDGAVTVRTADGNELGQLKRVERKSETEGAKPPAGATVLFDGKNIDQFTGARLGKGVLEVQGTRTGAITKKKFKDFTLHLEFRTPYMPSAKGQGRGNSGVYLQQRYECQVLDSFGLEGLDNECGGFYQLKSPNVNMCYPPLVWQTYDIEFTAAKYGKDDAGATKKTENARVTVKHNGVVIHDNLELPNVTPGGIEEGEEGGPLFLQDHGDAVVYRNIWVVEKS